ncbi:MAG: type II toxin-antitoxin system VapC family toxin [Spirochaetia bacterium]
MAVLLDTCVYLWILEDSGRLTEKVRKRLDKEYPRFVSSISFAEIEIKRSLGKLQIPAEYRDSLEDIGLSPLEFGVDDTLFLAELPYHHKDPFDRLLISQCIARKLSIVTGDAVFQQYPVEAMVI